MDRRAPRTHRNTGGSLTKAELFRTIAVGSRVTIRTPRGGTFTGRAYLRGPHGWVLGAGPHGARTAIADPDNLVKVRPSPYLKAVAGEVPASTYPDLAEG